MEWNPEDLWVWNVNSSTDEVTDIGTDVIEVEAQNVSGDYHFGYLDTQAVVWREKRTGEEEGTIYLSSTADGGYSNTNYIPPTVPTEP